MMRQYIGARYVPKFYQNSLDPDSTEWEPNVTYEHMVWVSLANGHMYLSKKTVPANIGTPAQNPEYWKEAGQFNGYIQNLQNQINDMKDGDVAGSLQAQINTNADDISDMKDGDVAGSLQAQINTLGVDTVLSTPNGIIRNAIFVGDSWTDGYLGVGVTPHSFVEEVISANIFQHIYRSSSTDSPGFINGTTFAQHFAAISAGKTDITDVIIEGGVNDSYIANRNQIIPAAISLFQTIRSTYPNARMYWFPNGGLPTDYTTSQVSSMNAIMDIMAALAPYGVITSLAPWQSIMYDENFYIADRLHPTSHGYDTFGVNVCNILLGRKPEAYPLDRTGGTVMFTDTFTQNGIDVTWVSRIDLDGNVMIEFARTGGASHQGCQIDGSKARMFPRNMIMANGWMLNSCSTYGMSGLSNYDGIAYNRIIKTSDLYFMSTSAPNEHTTHHVLKFNIFEAIPNVIYESFHGYA